MTRFADVIRQARLDADLSQTDAADQLGIEQSRLSAWERSANLPHEYRLDGLARLYGLDRAELLELWTDAKVRQIRGLTDEQLRRELDELRAMFQDAMRRLDELAERHEQPRGRRKGEA